MIIPHFQSYNINFISPPKRILIFNLWHDLFNHHPPPSNEIDVPSWGIIRYDL